jgi:hypothetical protein
MTQTQPPRVGFAGKRGEVWALLSSWVVPVIMAAAYVVLAITSETDTTGKAWMALGFAFVLVLWWVFRLLSETAALSRAVAVGDTDRVLEITAYQLSRKRGAAAAPLHIYRALAFEMRGEFEQCLAEANRVELTGLAESARKRWNLLAACARIGALVELGRTADARSELDQHVTPALSAFDARLEPAPHILGRLAKGRVLVAEKDPGALATLQTVIDDIRAGQGQRALAHHYASQVTTGAASESHRTKAAQQLPTAWFARSR